VNQAAVQSGQDVLPTIPPVVDQDLIGLQHHGLKVARVSIPIAAFDVRESLLEGQVEPGEQADLPRTPLGHHLNRRVRHVCLSSREETLAAL
jgi:hypothetical protein